MSEWWPAFLTFPRPPDFIVGGEDDPYLRRWHLLPRNSWFNVYLHNFRRSDDDRALHDHPYRNVSIILAGTYWEHTASGDVLVRKPWRPWAPWRIVFRRAEAAHRVQLLASESGESPVWTLFLTGPRVREWGFHCPNGWRHWREFTDERDGGAIGRGCGE
jgi:hypothetical protein